MAKQVGNQFLGRKENWDILVDDLHVDWYFCKKREERSGLSCLLSLWERIKIFINIPIFCPGHIELDSLILIFWGGHISLIFLSEMDPIFSIFSHYQTSAEKWYQLLQSSSKTIVSSQLSNFELFLLCPLSPNTGETTVILSGSPILTEEPLGGLQVGLGAYHGSAKSHHVGISLGHF